LKLIKIEDVKMTNNTLINERIDNASNLCSNLYINGLDFVGGLKNERLLTTVKIPNFQNQMTAYLLVKQEYHTLFFIVLLVNLIQQCFKDF
jgi:hypothetical protein